MVHLENPTHLPTQSETRSSNPKINFWNYQNNIYSMTTMHHKDWLRCTNEVSLEKKEKKKKDEPLSISSLDSYDMTWLSFSY